MSNILKQVIKLQDMVLSATVDFNNFERKLDSLSRALDGVVNYINEREHLHVHNLHLISEALKQHGIVVNLVVPTVIKPENVEINQANGDENGEGIRETCGASGTCDQSTEGSDTAKCNAG